MKMSHPLQSESWGSFRQAMGIDVVRLNEWQLTFHKIPFTPFTIGYFPKGPMPTKEMLAALDTLGKQKRAIFIQLEPNVTCHCEERSDAAISQKQPDEIASLIARNDKLLRPSHHPLFTKYTFVLDLTKSEEELLKAMHPKTRYNLKIAQKHSVVIKEDNSNEAFTEYLKLTAETTRRQGFYAHNEAYHTTMWHIMKKAGIAHLFTAAYQGSTLAAWIIFAWQDTVYYPYGASSRGYRDVMAPNLLLWEIARWAKSKGYKKFDLWGSLGPHPDEHDSWYGFHRFKQGFGPKLVEFVGSFDLILNPLLYRVYTLADTIRWKILKF
ncbi:MAG: peptidoglycan bridge formation glycyltransferase FemA/FemB family protein [Patescibacteria group bacterium]